MPELVGLSMRCPVLVMKTSSGPPWYSPISAAILAAMRPDIRVVQGSFESFVTKEERACLDRFTSSCQSSLRGAGATTSEDPNPDYQDRKAYVYFCGAVSMRLRPWDTGCF